MMYNSPTITGDMVNYLRRHDIEKYEKYMRLTNRGVVFSVTQFFIQFFPRGYGKSFMRCLDCVDEFVQSNEHVTEFGFCGTERGMLEMVLNLYFQDLEIVERKRDYLRLVNRNKKEIRNE